jgi:hypothetical protein
VVERLPSGSWYVTSPELQGLTLLMRDLREAESDLPWAVEHLMAFERGLRVHAGFPGDARAVDVLLGPEPALELTPLPRDDEAEPLPALAAPAASRPQPAG